MHAKDPRDRYWALHKSLWQAIGSRKDKFGQHVIEEPDFVPVEEGYSDSKPGDDFPVLRYLDQVLAIAGDHHFSDIARAFAAVADKLPWSQNPRYAQECNRQLLDGYAYASLSGPEGPIKCMAPRGGFYLMGPNVNYPSHNHAPREVYLIMTPDIEWRLDESGDWFSVEPGDLIYHAPWQMHAMRSGAAPALAYVAWLEQGSRLNVAWGSTAETA